MATDTLSKKLGNKIRMFRLVKEFTQENMAEALTMSVSGYSKIERGETDITLSRIEEIAHVFGVSSADLLTESTNVIHNIGTNSVGVNNLYGGEVKLEQDKRYEQLEKELASLKEQFQEMAKQLKAR